MSEQFKVGEVAIGQNFVDFTEYNGAELLVVGGLAHRLGMDAMDLNFTAELSYMVDASDGSGPFMCAPIKLRRKHPPTTGEQSIRAMFDAPPVERRQPATAWQAQCDTAQALMQMGVRVRSGKWPVEVEA